MVTEENLKKTKERIANENIKKLIKLWKKIENEEPLTKEEKELMKDIRFRSKMPY